MNKVMQLNTNNLGLLPSEVATPNYNRDKVKAAIVHIGIGGFHRAHQAYYTDELLHSDGSVWGICGIALLNTDRRIYDVLSEQDGLYTLMVKEPSGEVSARVIGSIVEFYFAPDNSSRVIEKIADPDVRIVTLTITEGGYNINSSNEFNYENPLIQWDLENPQQPRTIFGYLTQALKMRKEKGAGGLTIQSCDNIQHNGDVAKRMILAFVEKSYPELTDWINHNVAFPNSMVDSITPVTAKQDVSMLEEKFGIKDSWPVVCEPFHQWIIEDEFSNGRPAWEKVGAQFVPDVSPYEKMKIQLLNGGHLLLGFIGYLMGHRYVHEAATDPLLSTYLKNYMDQEVEDTLDKVADFDVEEYKNTIIARFKNEYIVDSLERIILGGSAKMPQFILPVVSERLKKGSSIKMATTVIAAWCHYLELASIEENKFEVQDEMRDILLERAKNSIDNDPYAFIKLESVFGNLISSSQFLETYMTIIKDIRSMGIRNTIKKQLNVK